MIEGVLDASQLRVRRRWKTFFSKLLVSIDKATEYHQKASSV